MKEYTNENTEPNSALSRAGKGSVFGVPPLYFESLSERIEEKIKVSETGYGELTGGEELEDSGEESGGLSGMQTIQGKLSYGTESEAEYFEGLNRRIFDRIEEDEEEGGLALFSASGLNSNPFSVPDHYFEESEERILAQFSQAKKKAAKPARLIALWNRPLTRIAVAATFTLLLVFSGLKIKNIQDVKREYANLPVDDKFYYSYDTDESLVEDELVSDPDSSADSLQHVKSDASKSSSSDNYLLDHKDEHTLVEEI